MKKPSVDVSLSSMCVAQTCGERKKPSVDVSLLSMGIGVNLR
jgi:hypothetical protein